MQTISIELFSINELSESAQEKAYLDWRHSGDTYHWNDDNFAVLKAFEDIFPLHHTDYEYGYRNFINYQHDIEDDISELTGLRLQKYIINNYWDDLYSPKYYSTSGHWVEGEYHYKSRYSKIQKERACLTGYCLGYDILKPLHDFVESKSPCNNTTFEDLLYDCLQSWVFACNADFEASQSLEYFKDTSEANEWTYEENGDIRH